MIAPASSNAQLTVTFPAADSVEVTADWYPVSDEYPSILLCHQNRFSRGEYQETALRLNKFGFNCLAIDQRVGSEVNGVINRTALAAKSRGQQHEFTDAEQDIRAGLDFLYNKYNKPVILMGSSYSASLAMKIANGNNKVLGVIVFSPGEYFQEKDFTRNAIVGLDKPLFATSSKEEAESVTDLLRDVNSRIKVQYVPQSAGDHGSKVLWSKSPSNQDYWVALMSFLTRMKKMQ
jgi:dienelactone hydrolase